MRPQAARTQTHVRPALCYAAQATTATLQLSLPVRSCLTLCQRRC